MSTLPGFVACSDRWLLLVCRTRKFLTISMCLRWTSWLRCSFPRALAIRAVNIAQLHLTNRPTCLQQSSSDLLQALRATSQDMLLPQQIMRTHACKLSCIWLKKVGLTWKIFNKRLFHASNRRYMQLSNHQTSTCTLSRHVRRAAPWWALSGSQKSTSKRSRETSHGD